MTHFVWYEHMTKDVKAAIAFYSEVVGWKTQPFPETQGLEPYTMWMSEQGPIGGVARLEDAGTPPHWMGHVGVDDLDAMVAKVKEKGGRVLVPPTPIPTVGRFSVIADPQGASLSLFEPLPMEQPMPPHDRTKHGEITWHELYADDGRAAFEFYSALFGWKILDRFDMGEAGPYLIFGEGDERYGGMMTKMPSMKLPPAWSYYVHVDDLDAAVARASAKGAKVLYGPMEVPDGTRAAQLVDPQGAVFGLHGSGKR